MFGCIEQLQLVYCGGRALSCRSKQIIILFSKKIKERGFAPFNFNPQGRQTLARVSCSPFVNIRQLVGRRTIQRDKWQRRCTPLQPHHTIMIEHYPLHFSFFFFFFPSWLLVYLYYFPRRVLKARSMSSTQQESWCAVKTSACWFFSPALVASMVSRIDSSVEML